MDSGTIIDTSVGEKLYDCSTLLTTLLNKTYTEKIISEKEAIWIAKTKDQGCMNKDQDLDISPL